MPVPEGFIPDSTAVVTPEGFVPDAPSRPPPPAPLPLWKDIAAHGLATLPSIGATLGGITGGAGGAIATPEFLGAGGVPLAIALGGIGAAGGRNLENVGRMAMHMPPNQSITQQMGLRLPPWLGGAVDVAEQGLLGGLTEGAGQGPAAAQRGLANFAKRSENKLAGAAMRKSGEIAAVGNIGPEAKAAEMAAREARRVAGAKIPQTIKAAGGELVTNAELADHIAGAQSSRWGSAGKKADLTKQVRKLLADVLEEHTAGAIRGGRDAYSLEVAEAAKQGLDAELSGTHAAAQRGVYRNPTIVRLARNALSDMIEAKAPGMAEANKAAGAAIRGHQDIRRLANTIRGPVVESIKQGRRARVAETMARQDFNRPFWEPHVGLHGASFPGMTAGRLALGGSRALAQPVVGGLLRYSPDTINFLIRAFMPQPGGAPPDQTQAPRRY